MKKMFQSNVWQLENGEITCCTDNVAVRLPPDARVPPSDPQQLITQLLPETGGGGTGEVGRDQNTEHDEWMILFASFPPSVPFASNGRDRNSNTKTGGLLPSPRSRGGANRFIQNGAT